MSLFGAEKCGQQRGGGVPCCCELIWVGLGCDAEAVWEARNKLRRGSVRAELPGVEGATCLL
jgi:hypothetical protein